MPEQPPIDHSLTPTTAQEKGYVWLFDIFDGTVHDLIVKSLLEDGCKLGVAEATERENAVGLYEPRKKPAPPTYR